MQSSMAEAVLAETQRLSADEVERIKVMLENAEVELREAEQ